MPRRLFERWLIDAVLADLLHRNSRDEIAILAGRCWPLDGGDVADLVLGLDRLSSDA